MRLDGGEEGRAAPAGRQLWIAVRFNGRIGRAGDAEDRAPTDVDLRWRDRPGGGSFELALAAEHERASQPPLGLRGLPHPSIGRLRHERLEAASLAHQRSLLLVE
jgi:hypothetical protein